MWKWSGATARLRADTGVKSAAGEVCRAWVRLSPGERVMCDVEGVICSADGIVFKKIAREKRRWTFVADIRAEELPGLS